jgi:hypothetical protein
VRTGRELWRNPRFRWTGRAVLGRLVGDAIDASDSDDPDLALLDPATGRAVAAVGQAAIVQAAQPYVLRRERTPGRRLVLGARTVVSRLDATGPQEAVGTVSGVVWQDCQGAGTYLACPTVLGQLTVHRVDGSR